MYKRQMGAQKTPWWMTLEKKQYGRPPPLPVSVHAHGRDNHLLAIWENAITFMVQAHLD